MVSSRATQTATHDLAKGRTAAYWIAFLSLCHVAAWPIESRAQKWEFSPALDTNVLYTNNSTIGTTNTPEKDTIVSLRPSLRILGVGARTTVEGDLAVQAREYVKGTVKDQVYPRGRLAVKTNLVDQWFYVEGSVVAQQTGADPFSLQGRLTSSIEDLTSYQYRVSPYLSHQLATGVSLLARSDNLWTRRSGDAALGLTRRDSVVQQNLVKLERQPTPLGASVEISSQRSKYPDSEESVLDLDAVRAVATYAAGAEVVLGVSTGRERSRFSFNGKSDALYGGSVEWRPSERTALFARVEHRFFGVGATAQVSHRSPFLALTLRFDREPIAEPSPLLLGPENGDVATLLNAAFTTRYPDPIQRDVIVRNFISSQGLPAVLPGPLDVFPDYVQLRNRLSLNAALLGRTTSVAFGLYGVKAIRLVREGGPYLPLPTDASDYREHGLTVDVNRRISPETTLTAILLKTRIDGLGPRAGDTSTETSMVLGVNHSLSPRTVISAGARRRLFSSNVNLPSQESAGFVGTNYRF